MKANVDIFSEIVAHMAMKSGIIGEVNIEQFQNMTKAVFGHVCFNTETVFVGRIVLRRKS